MYFPLRLLWRFSLLAVRVLVSTLSIAAGAVGAKGQSQALDQASGSIEPRLAYTPTAKGKAGIPTFEADMPAPSVRVGGGGHGAKAQEPKNGEHSISEQVGQMAEASQEQGPGGAEEKQETVLRERREDERPNPKKRMWEEPAGDVAQEQGNRARDEL